MYRSSGPGGQSVNTTDSAVRITHKPTGLVVAMQDEKSQLQNRAKALQVLRSRLLKLEQDRQAAEAVGPGAARSAAAVGARRSAPTTSRRTGVTDHRIGLTIYKLDKVLAGELDEVVDALVHDEQARRLSRAVRLKPTDLARALLDEAAAAGSATAARRSAHRRGGLGPRGRRPGAGARRLPPTRRTVARYRMVGRRVTGEPMQYVLGRWGFRTLDLFVDRRVLIPRPETEVVAGPRSRSTVDRAGSDGRSTSAPGSGAIGLRWPPNDRGVECGRPTCRRTPSPWPGPTSPASVGPASRVRVAEGEWFAALPADAEGTVDVIVSNPPYIAEHDRLPAEVSDWEPRDALIAGPTGLEAIDSIVTECAGVVAAYGRAGARDRRDAG